MLTEMAGTSRTLAGVGASEMGGGRGGRLEPRLSWRYLSIAGPRCAAHYKPFGSAMSELRLSNSRQPPGRSIRCPSSLRMNLSQGPHGKVQDEPPCNGEAEAAAVCASAEVHHGVKQHDNSRSASDSNSSQWFGWNGGAAHMENADDRLCLSLSRLTFLDSASFPSTPATFRRIRRRYGRERSGHFDGLSRHTERLSPAPTSRYQTQRRKSGLVESCCV